MRRIVLLLVSAGATLVFAAGASLVALQEPAHATFPGENGDLAFLSDSSIHTSNPDGSDLKKVPIDLPPGAEVYGGARALGGPVWSPDGSRLAFVSYQAHADSCDGRPRHDVWSVSFDGSGLRNLTGAANPDALGLPCEYEFQSPAWSPDAEKIALGVYDLDFFIGLVDADGSRFGGLPCQHACLWRVHAEGISWSPDGSKMAVGLRSYDDHEEYQELLTSKVWLLNADGSGKTELDAGLASEGQPSFSPDGSRIAFVGCTEWDYGNYTCLNDDVYVMGADGSDPTRLTDTPDQNEGSPAWSPDGSKIAFLRGGDVFTTNPDATGEAEPIAHQPSSSGVRPQDLDWGANGGAPTVARPKPKPGSETADRSPAVGAVVRDGEGDLAKTDIRLYVDGRLKGFSYDPGTGRLVRHTKKLSLGEHAVRIVATDGAGNRATEGWSFEVVKKG